MSQSIHDINKILNSENSDHNKLTTEDVDFILSSFYPSKQIEIHSLDLKPFSLHKLGYLGVHERLTIKLSELNKVEDVFKILSFVKGVASVSNAFEKLEFDVELKFYKEVMPQLMKNFTCEPWAPLCYLVKENLIILENLKDKGFKVIDGQLNIEHIKSAVISVAHFHASSFLLQERLQKSISEIFWGYFEQKSFVHSGFAWMWMERAGMEVIEAIACKLGLNLNYYYNAYGKHFNKITSSEFRKNVLCHLDLWSKNLVFKEGSEISCRLIDFQMCFYSSYVIDLVQLIYLNTTREVRQKFEKNLIELYHKTLKETLRSHDFDERKIISLQEVTQDFEDKRICGLVMAAHYLPISLLSGRFAKEFYKDSVTMNIYKNKYRKDFVMSVFKEDKYYRDRNEEAVRELLEFAEKLYTMKMFEN